jgi:hypothetical protein
MIPVFLARQGSSLNETASEGLGIAMSSIRLAEIVYLTEKARIASNVDRGIQNALAGPSHVFREANLNVEIFETMGRVPRSDVLYMPDRIVAATALYLWVPVIGRDGQIRSSLEIDRDHRTFKPKPCIVAGVRHWNSGGFDLLATSCLTR